MNNRIERFARAGAMPLLVLLAALVSAMAVPEPALAQLPGGTRAVPANPARGEMASVPFGPGERAEYQVKMGAFNVGAGHMEVHRIAPVRGQPSYHLSMGIQGGRLGLNVDNTYQSWLDIHQLTSRRFIQDQHELRSKRFRRYEFFPEERRYERADIDDAGDLPTDLPLDDLAFVYYVRSLPLEVGETYILDQYFKEDGNPVEIRVLRKERVEVPAGTFNTIVVQPIIKTDGLFGEGGEAEVYFSDDDRRIMVKMTSRMPVIRSLSLHLTDIRYARPLEPSSFASERREDDSTRNRALD